MVLTSSEDVVAPVGAVLVVVMAVVAVVAVLVPVLLADPLVTAMLVDPAPKLAKVIAVLILVEETRVGLVEVRALEAVQQTIAVLVVQMLVVLVVRMPAEAVVPVPVALVMLLLPLYQSMQVQHWKTYSLAIAG